MGRIIYNSQALYVGPSGKNFINCTGGNLINSCLDEDHFNYLYSDGENELGSGSGESGSGSGESGSGSGESGSGSGESGSGSGDSNSLCSGDIRNLVSQLDGIQNFNYQITVPRQDLIQINTSKMLDRPIIQSPQVDFSFDYFISDISNEAKMGFYVNFPQYDSDKFGEPFFESLEKEKNNGVSLNGGNFSCSILSGFFSEEIGEKEFTQSDNSEPFYPTESYRDKRNYYLAVRNDRRDINVLNDPLQADEYSHFDENAENYNVVAFGNCYMSSYSTSASVGSLPIASVSFVGENIIFETSGVDFNSPSIESKSGKPLLDEYNRNLTVSLPSRKKENKPVVINPGDITFNPEFIYENGEKVNSFTGIGVNFSNIHLDSYSIKMDIPRDVQGCLGYKFPLDRRVDSTAPVSLSINGIISGMGDSRDTLEDLIQVNQDYDFNIALKGPRCKEDIFLDDIANLTDFKYKTINEKNPLINYFFKSAKLNSFNYSSSIGDNLVFSAEFSTEIDPDDLSKGFFISGFLTNSKC